MMFLHNCWYVAGWSHHIAADSLVSRTMLGEPIVLYRKADGGVVALEDRCCHRLAPPEIVAETERRLWAQ
jgi:phenylpropionate dioxygenase-like ring-hydroxylating dioxygenase large terminal subunit